MQATDGFQIYSGTHAEDLIPESVCRDAIHQNDLYKDYILPYTDHLLVDMYHNNTQFNKAKSEVQIYLAIKQFLRELFADSGIV